MTKRKKIRLAKKHGILMPRRAYWAAKKYDIPYYVMCAFLMQESSGGQNVWGHDGGPEYPFYGHGDGTVTKNNYSVYKIEAERTGKRQGVGPMQLTHSSFQNRADELGGCWKPYPNMKAAAEWMRGQKTGGKKWIDVAAAYNPGSSAYREQMRERLSFWRKVMDGE